jgi:hypothetical protein
MNTENAMAEQIRQYNESVQRDIEKWNKEQEFNIHKFNEETRQAQQDHDRQAAKDKADADAEDARLKEEIRQFDKTFEALYGDEGKNAPITGSSGSSGGSAVVNRTAQAAGIASVVNGTRGKTVTTDYFSGTLPASTIKANNTYGTFANGYQPKGIAGYGTVSKTGQTISVQTKTLSGETRTVKQNVWKTPDGSLWYWEGREMKYKPIQQTASSGGGGATGWHRAVM